MNTNKELLDDEKTLQEQDLHEDDVIYYVLKQPDSEEWEEVDIVQHGTAKNTM